MLAAAGFALAGGRSSRMGRDKALLRLDGETLIARALRILTEVSSEVAIAGGAPELARFARLIPDAFPGRGPLSGIVAGLSASCSTWNNFISVDTPFISATVFHCLLDQAGSSDAVAVLARAGGQEHPLCGVYSRAALPVLREELLAGRGKITAALERAGTIQWVDFAECQWFRNLNTPEEFAAVQPPAR